MLGSAAQPLTITDVNKFVLIRSEALFKFNKFTHKFIAIYELHINF